MPDDAIARAAEVLARPRRRGPWAARGAGHAAAARHALVSGPKTASQLQAAIGDTSVNIRGLLKADVNCGRVLVSVQGHRATYSLSPNYLAGLDEEIARARALLERQGWIVTRPARQAATAAPEVVHG